MFLNLSVTFCTQYICFAHFQYHCNGCPSSHTIHLSLPYTPAHFCRFEVAMYDSHSCHYNSICHNNPYIMKVKKLLNNDRMYSFIIIISNELCNYFFFFQIIFSYITTVLIDNLLSNSCHGFMKNLLVLCALILRSHGFFLLRRQHRKYSSFQHSPLLYVLN